MSNQEYGLGGTLALYAPTWTQPDEDGHTPEFKEDF